MCQPIFKMYYYLENHGFDVTTCSVFNIATTESSKTNLLSWYFLVGLEYLQLCKP